MHPRTISARPSARSICRSVDIIAIGMLLPGQTEPRFVSGQYCRVDAPRTLSFTWGLGASQAGLPETQVTLDFMPRESGTDLVLTHERFRSEPDKNSHAQGWEGCLNRLNRKFGG